MNARDDDPRISAYLLNELSPEERAAFEAEMAADPELKSAVDEFAESISLVAVANDNSSSHERPRLDAQHRSTIEQVLACGKPRFSRPALRAIAVCAALVLLGFSLWMASLGPATNSIGSRRATAVLIARLSDALKQYRQDFRSLPPDTGFGLAPSDLASGAGARYDAGSLWRYLAQPIKRDGKLYGPYLKLEPSELLGYSDPVHGPSFCVVDKWGTPIGYVGSPSRVLHNRGDFDIFSAGPDRKTGQDVLRIVRANLAYDGVDNDGDGVADNSGELGSATLNGCMTVAHAELGLPSDSLDDINNWDQQD